MRGSRRRDQAGFTLIEIMVVVAIIAILAAIVIPSWIGSARKGKYDPEVRAMFAEISAKEEQYKIEIGNGAYSTLTTCPGTTSQNGVDLLAQACYTGTWVTTRILPTDTKVRCTYAVVPGAAGTTPTAPAGFTLPTNVASFTAAWYYILATCDMDGQSGTTAATFFTSSWDTSVQKLNYGT